MRYGPDSPPARRLRLAFELHEAGVALKRQTLRRQHPEAAEAEIDAILARWLRREGEPADAPGSPRPWQDRVS
jgi:hypothetical protein